MRGTERRTEARAAQTPWKDAGLSCWGCCGSQRTSGVSGADMMGRAGVLEDWMACECRWDGWAVGFMVLLRGNEDTAPTSSVSLAQGHLPEFYFLSVRVFTGAAQWSCNCLLSAQSRLVHIGPPVRIIVPISQVEKSWVKRA